MADRVASLSMYDITETAAATDAWWAGLARHFAVAGVADPPALLARPGQGEDFWLRPDLLFSQTCGYPFITSLTGKVTLLATPGYDAPGCEGPDYCSLLIVRADAPWERFRDLDGRCCAVNSADSWSGHHALRILIAREGGQGPFSCTAFASGGHAASIAAVAGGQADFAAIDCVTYATLSRHRPSAVAGIRVLCHTPAMPGLPLIAGQAASAADIEAMRQGLAAAAVDPELADARAVLGIAEMHFPHAGDYNRLAVALAEHSEIGALL
ncbi:MAG: PhnD/SsuA/transferrin family substrate-binding protein [Alphaproteobacteria bacterium]|nr:PhnD/SsuA/transferrin family substrate-binding protein [Alphaproteobacteria bacterium]